MFKVVAVLLAGYVAASLVSGYTVTHDVVDNMQRTNEVDPSYEDDYYEETSGPDLFMEEDYLIDDIPMYMEGSPVTIGEDDVSVLIQGQLHKWTHHVILPKVHL